MIRDGIDPQPVASAIDEALRADGWVPIGDIGSLGVGKYGGRLHALMIDGLTSDGRMVKAIYHAQGDYLDRWSNPQRNTVFDLTHYRPRAT